MRQDYEYYYKLREQKAIELQDIARKERAVYEEMKHHAELLYQKIPELIQELHKKDQEVKQYEQEVQNKKEEAGKIRNILDMLETDNERVA